MIPVGATRIASVTVSNGVVNVRFAGTKQGVCFTSMAQLNEQILRAQELNPFVQFMLQIADHLKNDPTLAAPSALSSRPFIADTAPLPDMVID